MILPSQDQRGHMKGHLSGNMQNENYSYNALVKLKLININLNTELGQLVYLHVTPHANWKTQYSEEVGKLKASAGLSAISEVSLGQSRMPVKRYQGGRTPR